jgi:hypothetical protein
VTKITGSRSDDWIYWRFFTITLNYKPYNAIADLHTFQFIVVHALGFSVSNSRILATDLNKETITLNHYKVFLPFLSQSSCTADSAELHPILQFYLQSDLVSVVLDCVLINATNRLPLYRRGTDHAQKTQPLYCCVSPHRKYSFLHCCVTSPRMRECVYGAVAWQCISIL